MTTSKSPQMQEFLSAWVSSQNARGFSELPKLPSQQNQTFGISCFRLAQESLRCDLSFSQISNSYLEL